MKTTIQPTSYTFCNSRGWFSTGPLRCPNPACVCYHCQRDFGFMVPAGGPLPRTHNKIFKGFCNLVMNFCDTFMINNTYFAVYQMILLIGSLGFAHRELNGVTPMITHDNDNSFNFEAVFSPSKMRRFQIKLIEGYLWMWDFVPSSQKWLIRHSKLPSYTSLETLPSSRFQMGVNRCYKLK